MAFRPQVVSRQFRPSQKSVRQRVVVEGHETSLRIHLSSASQSRPTFSQVVKPSAEGELSAVKYLSAHNYFLLQFVDPTACVEKSLPRGETVAVTFIYFLCRPSFKFQRVSVHGGAPLLPTFVFLQWCLFEATSCPTKPNVERR